MENEIKKIFDDARSISLTAEEKVAGRRMFSEYMMMRPVRGTDGGKVTAHKPFGFRSLVLLAKPLSVFTLVLSLMLSAAGVSYAAEGALPGEALYPVKVGINEEIRAAAAISVIDQVRWENERVSRRLSEAEALARKGQFKAEAATELQRRLEVHLGAAKALVAGIDDDDDDDDLEAMLEIDASFEGNLRAHKFLLGVLNMDVAADAEGSSARLAAIIDLQSEIAAARRIGGEERLSAKAEAWSSASIEARTKAARKAIARTNALLGKTRGRMDAETAASVDLRLKAAGQAMVEREAKLAAGDHTAGFRLFLDAIRDVDEGRALIEAGALMTRAELRSQARIEKQKNEKQVKNEAGQEDGKNEEEAGNGSGAQLDAGLETKLETDGGDGDDETDDGGEKRQGGANLKTEGRLKLGL